MLISAKFSVQTVGQFVEVHHADNPVPVLRFSVVDGFITAARADGAIREVVDASGLPRHGHYPLDYCVREQLLDRYDTLQEWRLTPKPTGFVITGILKGPEGSVSFQFSLNAVSDQRLCFGLKVDSPAVNRLWLKFSSPEDEHIFGFGEQFSFLDLKGHRVPIYVMEKGIGRGLEPLTSFMDLAPYPEPMEPTDALVDGLKFESHFGTHSYGTYIPVPYFMSSLGRALVLDSTEFSVFDFRDRHTAEIELWASEMSGSVFVGASPRKILAAYTAYAGRMPRLPEWLIDGMMIVAGGGSDAVRRTVDQAVAAYDSFGIPVTSVNIYDWQGSRTGDVFIERRLWWTFEPDATLYPDWEEMVRELRTRSIRVFIYYNPMVACDATEQKKNLRRDVFKLASAAGYLVRKPDGSPYVVSSGIVKAALFDLTNPAAREWLKDLMKEQIKVGVSGWMSDFAEGLPHDAVLFSGEDAAAYHNRYPVEFAKLNREVLIETGTEHEVNFHSRSGYTFSSRYTTGFFTGDQLNTWDHYGGFKTTVNALISGGLSGFQYFIFTYGGYWTIKPENVLPKLPHELTNQVSAAVAPLLRAEMTPELRARRLELLSFGAYAMFGAPEPDELFRCFATIVTELAPYRKRMGIEAAEEGLPLVRHLMLEFPDDPQVYALQYQYMYGSDFLFRPVVDPGVSSVAVYLPAGSWIHLFSGSRYGDVGSGVWVDVDAPVGKPAVFFRAGASAGEQLLKRMQHLGVL